jgi:hypothetical protein
MIDLPHTFHKVLIQQRIKKELKIIDVLKALPNLNHSRIKLMEQGSGNVTLKNYRLYWNYLFDLQIENEVTTLEPNDQFKK